MNNMMSYEEECAEGFICPITKQLMTDPVLAEDGIYYERAAITEWLMLNNTSPVTRQIISSNFITDQQLKLKIEQYKKMNMDQS
ncbi:MAG: hypothetical protein EZS28_030615 [Streblomastix strix]|uniref:U-box domain-containing protein n=1 Tax=Streblomastix strix TaxID=222440 RepID=A0A5J4UUJ8_9EUKA|nr:MAG: hypothetical protein EZS28_030615 [Streblomastix strix]